MAGISSTLSRKDLKFMAEDIGPQLVPFMKTEDLMSSMDKKKQLRLVNAMLAQLVAEMGPEKLLTELDPEIQKRFAGSTSQVHATIPANDKETHDPDPSDNA